MDVTGGLVPQSTLPQGGSSAGQVKVPHTGPNLGEKAVSSTPRISDKSVEGVKDNEAGRLDRVRSGAQMVKQMLGSGETFAIYRSSGSGELVTRFTNRTNGTIRYIPEQSIVQFKEAIDHKKEAIVDTKA